ncbi:MAG TPA: hypothetical protein VNA23_03540 [Anaerolineales bacterium]|nr:hypothetical protein [Anaerolineales bacterium]
MRPALVFPFNDPDGILFPHLQSILPDLKRYFERAYICPPLSTLQRVGQLMQLQADDFFTIFPVDRMLSVGEHFAYLYQRAANTAPPDQLLHLCYIDRLTFALEGDHKSSFLADVGVLTSDDLPLIFQRSEVAWGTHPQNYRDIEGMVTTVGRHLFGRDLDYAWCHIVVQTAQLRRIMPLVKNTDLSMVAEMIFYLQHHIQTREVDWLAWEDPFILSRDAVKLKYERETSLEETQKRLSYALPMMETLTRLAQLEIKERSESRIINS